MYAKIWQKIPLLDLFTAKLLNIEQDPLFVYGVKYVLKIASIDVSFFLSYLSFCLYFFLLIFLSFFLMGLLKTEKFGPSLFGPVLLGLTDVEEDRPSSSWVC